MFEVCEPEPTVKGGTVEIGEQLELKQRSTIEGIVEEFEREFADDLLNTELNTKAPPFKIDLKEGFRLERLRSGNRKRSPEEAQTIKDFVTKMSKAGLIEEAYNVPHAACLVLVKQKGKTRVCIDFRHLNEGTKEDLYPQERADQVLASFEGCKFLSTLDATSGYWQVPIAQESQHLVAFKCAQGTFKWTRLPFGLVNAPSHYNRWMTKVLDGLDVKRYVDDIIIASRTWQEHVDKLRQVLQRCREHGVKLKPSKCHIGMKEVQVLGHIVSSEGVRPDPMKTRAMAEMAPPTNVKELRTFLGMSSFYRKFCYNFSAKTDKMRKLLKKASAWTWTEEHQKEFEEIKRALTSEDVCLRHPNLDEPFYLFVDASKQGIGAVLMQEDKSPGIQDEQTVPNAGQSDSEGEPVLGTRADTQENDNSQLHMKLRVVEYWSRAVTEAESHYGITDLEGLGVVSAVEYWHPYIYGGEATVITDHKPLLAQVRSSNSRQIRWRLRLAPYRFSMRWMKGADHGAADGLSRDPAYATVLAISATLMEASEQEAEKDKEIVGARTTLQVDDAAAESRLYVNSEYLRECLVRERPLEKCLPTISDLDVVDDIDDNDNQDEEDHGNDHDWSERKRALQRDLRTAEIMEYATQRCNTWEDEQAKDAWIAAEIAKIKKGSNSVYEIKRGLLMRGGRTVVPKVLQRIVMHFAHNGVAAGHPNAARTYQEVRRRFFWTGLKSDVERWVQGCKCAKGKLRARTKGETKVFQEFGPFQAIHMDFLVDTLENAGTGNRYVLAIVDRATGWVALVSTRSRSAEDVAIALIDHWIHFWGCPLVIFSDNEKAYNGKLMEELHNSWKSAGIFFAPYQHGNGLAERTISILTAETVVRKCREAGDLEAAGSLKQRELTAIAFWMNATPGETTPCAIELATGVKPTMPLDQIMPVSLGLSSTMRNRLVI